MENSAASDYDLMVIGAGPGGYEAAEYAARRYGKRVVLFEKASLGGTCLNAGCIPTKCLLRSAKNLSECRSASAFGVALDGSADAMLNMTAVQARKQKVVATLQKGIAAMLRSHKVEVVNAEAKIAAPGVIEADGRCWHGANILIATGSMPAVPPIPGLRDNPAVLDSTGILALDHIPESLVIIGGGVIGLELATFFATSGQCKVSIVEMMQKIAPVVDDEIGRKLLAGLKRAGIAFYLGAQVQGIECNTVKCRDANGNDLALSAEVILNATGRRPVVSGLGLEACGVEVDRKGIVTDAFGRTSVAGIWACGDVTGRCLLAHAATREGYVAVNNMFGDACDDTVNYNAIPSVIYTHPEVAQVGATEQALIADGTPYRKLSLPMATAGRFVVDTEGESGTVKVLVHAETNELLGMHAVGGNCGEFICAAAILVGERFTPEQVAKIVFPHPTVSEALREVAMRG